MAHSDIAPNTNIRILQNVPLENDYINTLYFADVNAQRTYFQSKTKYNLTHHTYQRVNKGICRVQYKVEDLYDCNYIMFQNESFGNKWFYAFITQVDYVNNITSDIHYELDVLQSWFFEMSLTYCFVEREHSVSDDIGLNIAPEPVDIGEYVFNWYRKIEPELDEYCIAMVVATKTEAGGIQYSPEGNLINSMYSGCQIYVTPASAQGVHEINLKLQVDYVQAPDNILAIYMLPRAALSHPFPTVTVGGEEVEGGYWLTNDEYLQQNARTIILPEVNQQTGNRDAYKIGDTLMLDGYQPKNNKLYTYPYNFLHVDNANGRELNLRYEFFTDDTGVPNLCPQFRLTCNALLPVSSVLRPFNYKGIHYDGQTSDYSALQTDCSESIDLTNYPICAWTVDAFKAWLAQNSVPEAISAIADVASIATGAIGGTIGLAGASNKVINDAAQILTNHYKASIQADICKGSLNNGNINCASKRQNFFLGRVSLNRRNAVIIDNFFDRFGYATNKVKIPNISSRPHWNYVKTIGSNINGNIPANDKKIIDNIFNSGITFWKTPTEVDNYSLDNSPI